MTTIAQLHISHPVTDERVWAFRYKTTVTAFAVVSVRYVVLIDTLVNATTAQAMVDALREPLQTRQLLVINSHADWDHCWGNMIFAGPHATYPAPIIVHRLCRERMLGDEARTKLREKQAEDPAMFGDVVLIPPTITFEDELQVDGGDMTVRLIRTPGHTVDHVSVFIPEARLLFPGDAAEDPFPLVPDAAGLPQLRASLARLHMLNAETVLYCHADSTKPDVIEQNIAYFDALEGRVRASHVVEPLDEADLEALVGFPFDDVPGADQLNEEERAFYRPAHHAAIKAMIAWVQNTAD